MTASCPSFEPNACWRRVVLCSEDNPKRSRVSTGKVKVCMGVSELVIVALVGLALFGGAIKIKFKGFVRRPERQKLKDSEQKLLDE